MIHNLDLNGFLPAENHVHQLLNPDNLTQFNHGTSVETPKEPLLRDDWTEGNHLATRARNEKRHCVFVKLHHPEMFNRMSKCFSSHSGWNQLQTKIKRSYLVFLGRTPKWRQEWVNVFYPSLTSQQTTGQSRLVGLRDDPTEGGRKHKRRPPDFSANLRDI